MDLSKEDREQFKILSQQLFGSSTVWKKILDRGTTELQTRTIIEDVPGENGAEPTKKESKVPVLAPNGTKQYYQKYYTVDELKAFMLDIKAKRDVMIANMIKQQEEAKKKKDEEDLLKKIQEDAGGSTL